MSRSLSVPICLVTLAFLSPARGDETVVSVENLRNHVEFLASDVLAGRDSGEPGLEVAAEYIAHQFRQPTP